MVMTYDQYDFPNSFEFETFSSDIYLAVYHVVSDRPNITDAIGSDDWEDFVDENLVRNRPRWIFFPGVHR